jgi:hypothetical protein
MDSNNLLRGMALTINVDRAAHRSAQTVGGRLTMMNCNLLFNIYLYSNQPTLAGLCSSVQTRQDEPSPTCRPCPRSAPNASQTPGTETGHASPVAAV